ncbi:MAG: SRPBCC family protein [Vicinamibacterales bacterium]
MRQTDSCLRAHDLAMGIGWFSLALGAAELAVPGRFARLIGASDSDDTRRTLRAFGAREIASGLALLAQPGRPQWLWSRVWGDAMDLGWLAREARLDNADRRRLGVAAAVVAGVSALDAVAARRMRSDSRAAGFRRERAVRVEQVVTVNRTIDDVFAFWRDFENFPRFMRHLKRVEVIDSRRSRWRAAAPMGMTMQWDAEILAARPNEWISWRSLPGSDVINSGSVRFAPAPGARGTEVRVQLEYMPPGGPIGRGVAWLFGEEPEQQVREDLRRFKQLMETGSIPVSDAPGLWRAAQPAKRPERLREYAGVEP